VTSGLSRSRGFSFTDFWLQLGEFTVYSSWARSISLPMCLEHFILRTAATSFTYGIYGILWSNLQQPAKQIKMLIRSDL